MVLDNPQSAIRPWAVRIFMIPLEESWELKILSSQLGEVAFRRQLMESLEVKF